MASSNVPVCAHARHVRPSAAGWDEDTSLRCRTARGRILAR
jgi:hypothetical protein